MQVFVKTQSCQFLDSMCVYDDGLEDQDTMIDEVTEKNANRLNNKETVSNAVWIPTTMDSRTKI